MIPLTPQQILFFETFGFLYLPNLLGELTNTVINKFDQLFSQHNKDVFDWRHEAHYNNARQILLQFIERDTFLSSLLEHPQIDGLLHSLLGDDYLYRVSEGNIFEGDTFWHSDLYNADFKYRHLKVLFYLDGLDANSGALRVIPGSQLFGDKYANSLERYVWEHDKNYGLAKEAVPSIIVPSRPGDAIVINYRLKHATCNSHGTRRMFTICASQRFNDEDLPSLKKLVQELCAVNGGKLFQDDFVQHAPPQRLKHLDQCLESLKP